MHIPTTMRAGPRAQGPTLIHKHETQKDNPNVDDDNKDMKHKHNQKREQESPRSARRPGRANLGRHL